MLRYFRLLSYCPACPLLRLGRHGLLNRLVLCPIPRLPILILLTSVPAFVRRFVSLLLITSTICWSPQILRESGPQARDYARIGCFSQVARLGLRLSCKSGFGASSFAVLISDN